jgi:hypothetical protein
MYSAHTVCYSMQLLTKDVSTNCPNGDELHDALHSVNTTGFAKY